MVAASFSPERAGFPCRTHADAPLDVMLVHFSSVPRGAYGDLEKGRKKIRPAPKSLGGEGGATGIGSKGVTWV